MRKLNNKGETLLELVLSIAMFTILFVAAMTYYTSSSTAIRAYSDYSTDGILCEIGFSAGEPVYKLGKTELTSLFYSNGIGYEIGTATVTISSISADNGAIISIDSKDTWLKDSSKVLSYVRGKIGGINLWGFELQ